MLHPAREKTPLACTAVGDPAPPLMRFGLDCLTSVEESGGQWGQTTVTAMNGRRKHLKNIRSGALLSLLRALFDSPSSTSLTQRTNNTPPGREDL